MPFQIYLFTAPVKAGKTTTLMNWVRKRPGIGGFLAPDIEELRYLYTLRDRQLHAFQLTNDVAVKLPPEEVTSIHKFNFLAEAFDLARRTLLTDIREALDWVIVDEVGKLEVRGAGLEPVVGEAVEWVKSGKARAKLLLVVREELLQEVIDRYGLLSCRVVRLGEGLPE